VPAWSGRIGQKGGRGGRGRGTKADAVGTTSFMPDCRRILRGVPSFPTGRQLRAIDTRFDLRPDSIPNRSPMVQRHACARASDVEWDHRRLCSRSLANSDAAALLLLSTIPFECTVTSAAPPSTLTPS
jgi:hypothetical protein